MYLSQIIITVFAGSLNDEAKLAGVGLGIGFSAIFCSSILIGMNGALQTLASQAYGFGSLHLCGVHFKIGQVILTLIFIPIAVMLSFSEQILIKLGQDPQVASYAYQFIMVTLPATYCFAMFDLTKRFLNSMLISTVPMTAQIIATICQPFICHLFVNVYELDIIGLGIGVNLTQITLLLCVLCHAHIVPEISEAM